jgi:3-oxoadipate enol-lactonase
VPSKGRLRYLEASPTGSARPLGTLVLIHAFPLHAGLWEPQLALSQQGWRVIAPHLKGLGPDAGEPATSMDDFAGEVIDLLDSLHIEDAVIGGLSLGGYVVFALLRHAPAYVRGLILADTRSQADAPAALEGRTRMIELVSAKGPEAVGAEMMPKLLGETTRRERQDVVTRVQSMIRDNTAEGIAGAITAMMHRPDSTSLLGTIRCPTLVIVGSEDTLTPPSVSEDMARAIPGSQLTIVDGAGHLSNLERPDAFTEAVATFLARRL